MAAGQAQVHGDGLEDLHTNTERVSRLHLMNKKGGLEKCGNSSTNHCQREKNIAAVRVGLRETLVIFRSEDLDHHVTQYGKQDSSRLHKLFGF